MIKIEDIGVEQENNNDQNKNIVFLSEIFFSFMKLGHLDSNLVKISQNKLLDYFRNNKNDVKVSTCI